MMTFASPEWISKEYARHFGSLGRPLALDPIIFCLHRLTTRNKVMQAARSFISTFPPVVSRAAAEPSSFWFTTRTVRAAERRREYSLAGSVPGCRFKNICPTWLLQAAFVGAHSGQKLRLIARVSSTTIPRKRKTSRHQAEQPSKRITGILSV